MGGCTHLRRWRWRAWVALKEMRPLTPVEVEGSRKNIPVHPKTTLQTTPRLPTRPPAETTPKTTPRPPFRPQPDYSPDRLQEPHLVSSPDHPSRMILRLQNSRPGPLPRPPSRPTPNYAPGRQQKPTPNHPADRPPDNQQIIHQTTCRKHIQTTPIPPSRPSPYSHQRAETTL